MVEHEVRTVAAVERAARDARRDEHGASAGEPGSPPFVEVGDAVEEDTVVGLLETMKLFNSVHAGVRGTVTEICVANAEAAEQGAVLARVRPA